jgi:two-component system sensor histidine kinase CpxA
VKLRFPLYTKILLWCVLNLVVLVVVFFIFFRIQFRIGLDSLVLGLSGPRLDSTGRVIMDELSAAPRENWNSILSRFSSGYHVQFGLFTPNGHQQAGDKMALPAEVLARMRDQPREPRPRPLDRRPPVPPEEPPPMGGPMGELPPPPGMAAGEPPPFAAPFQKFMVRTAQPTQYWVGLRAPLRPVDRARVAPLVLIAVSSSLSGGGLFVDLAPWYAVGGGVLLLSGLLWFPLIRGITRTILQVTRATERIAEGNFDVRLAIQRADELGRLAHAVNQLGTRLNGFVTGQKRFLGDIAHELCSPLARAEMALSVLEQKIDPTHQESIEDVREEVRAMSALVNELLSFSKAGLKARDLQLSAVPLRELAERVVARESVPAEKVRLEIASDHRAMAEPELLARAVGNLLRNAVRYAGDAGPITIGSDMEGGKIVLRVTDQGPGVPEIDLARLGEPFYRPDVARARESGGVGLGLAIVRTCVDACRGALTLRNVSPRGLEAAISLDKA